MLKKPTRRWLNGLISPMDHLTQTPQEKLCSKLPVCSKELLGEQACSICLQQLHQHKTVTMLCLHKLHERCLMKLVQSSDGLQCPECKVDMLKAWQEYHKLGY